MPTTFSRGFISVPPGFEVFERQGASGEVFAGAAAAVGNELREGLPKPLFGDFDPECLQNISQLSNIRAGKQLKLLCTYTIKQINIYPMSTTVDSLDFELDAPQSSSGLVASPLKGR